ncbi:MAG: PAS domain S-box protein [Caulobacter sp.]|nr:PAS domain S-box protein [Caulobacter sp.]
MTHDEARRVRELRSYGILDSSPEEAFDRITELARDLFDAPIALVSLIDDQRQWFKSRQGLAACSTPRDMAFCSHAIALEADAVMVVQDAAGDSRFADNPLVTGEPGIRFYAGAVLTSPSGFNLGTLCVIDTQPRGPLAERELSRLKALAKIVVDEMERGRVNRVRWEQARLLQLAETMSGVAHWRYDMAASEVFWSNLVYEIHGRDRRTYTPTVDANLTAFHPDDRERVRAELRRSVETREPCTFQARLIRADGVERIVLSKASCEVDEQGKVIALVGVFQDITEQARNLEELTASEARYRLLAENTSDVIVRASTAGRLLYVSPASRAMGYEPEDLIGTSVDRLVHPDDRDRFLANTAALLGDAPVDPRTDRQHRYLAGDGRWVWLEGNPQVVRDAEGRPVEIVNVFRDVTERRALQEHAEHMARLTALAEEVAGIGYWRIDTVTGQVTSSPHVAAMYGLDPATDPEVARFVEAVHPDDRPALRARLRQAIEQGVNWKLAVTRIVLPSGELRYLEGHGYCERNPAGAVVAVFGTVVDITTRVRAEITRTENEARYHALSERALLAARAGQIGVWEWNVRTDELAWDERMYALYGVESGTPMSSTTFGACLHPEDRAVERRQARAAIDGDAPYDTEFRVVHPNGEVRAVRALATLVRAEDGSPLRFVGVNWDVTDIRNLELSLRASEDRARNIIDKAHQAIVTADEKGRITGWNQYARLTFGWTAQEALGSDINALILPAGAPGIATYLQGDGVGDLDQRAEVTARRKDGAEFPIELAISATRGATGWEMTALMHDISERKAQLELFENAFEHAAIGKALVGLDGSFLKVNPPLCDMVGYTREEFLALDFQAITHPDDLEADLELVDSLREGRISTYRMDKRYIRKNGEILWIQLAVSRVDNPDGSPRHYIAQIEDLTARRLAEAALKESEARYRLMAENTTDMIVTADLEGRITFVAPSCETLIGYAPHEVLGRGPADLAYPDEQASILRTYRKLLAGAPAERVRWRVAHKQDGREVWLESNPSVLRDPVTEAPTGFLDVIREVTSQVAQERALADARAAAEDAAAVKSEFLANMSHEIRTPLTAVIGFSGLLSQRPELDEVSRRFVQRVSSAGEALLAIVNDILDFSKLEAGQVEITPRPCSPLVLARDALTLFTPQADAKGLWLECEAEGEVPAAVMIDPDRLRQVLLNLVGNAVKFTDQGSVRLAIGYEASTGMLRARVEDTGAGMSEDQQHKLFQRFSQVDASSTRRHGGTGLGLAICKGLTEAMGGGIAVSSTLGVGSIFTFHINAPLAEAVGQGDEFADAPIEGHQLDGVRVLVADDNAVNRELARAVLEPLGAAVSDVEDGQAALDIAALEPFDCILMDLRMPGLSGLQALQALREASGPNQDVPVLAFTADADRALLDHENAFDGVVSKPIAALDLARAVIACTDWTQAPPESDEGAGLGRAFV